MSTSLQPQEHELVVRARGLALRVLEDPRVTTALSVAENTKGLVITNENEATLANDHLAALLAGEKALAAELKRIIAIPKAMERAVKDAADPTSSTISGAVTGLKNAIQAHLARQRAAAEAARRRIENERIAAEREREARRAAVVESLSDAASEDDEAPPLETPIPEAPRKVISGAGQAFETKHLECESVNFHDWEPSWARLDTAAAKAEFRVALRRGDVMEPKEGESVTWRGVRFSYRLDLTHKQGVAR